MKKTHAITHPIVYTATRLEAIANRFIFAPMNTTAASMKILGLLLKHGPLTPRRIMELIGGTKSNVSQRLRYLEKSGFIIRNQDSIPADLRKVLVKLTSKGKSQLFQIRNRMRKAQICLAGHFREEDISQHVRFLKKVNAIIDQEEKNLSKIFK